MIVEQLAVQMRKIKNVFIGFLFLLVAVWGVKYFSGGKGEFSLFNKSNDGILNATVIVCGQEYTFKNLAPNAFEQRSFRVTCGGAYKVNIEFNSGRKIFKELGYVTIGIEPSAQIIVSNSGIEISSANRK